MEKEQEYYGKIYDRAILSDRDGFVDFMTRDKIPFDEIIANEIISLSGLDKEIVLSTYRKIEVMTARQFLHYSVLELTNLTEHDTGAKYGDFDHSTVLNSVYRIKGYLETNDPQLYPFRNFIERNNLK